ncbi:MAG: hypothetical protein MI725_05365 [Pirellulales bacterium]|nr:hypothetical protein [Pirellulales bacterium]
MLYRFHVNVFGQPFACTWEEVAARLQELPRMIFEPDGSWIWSGASGADRWQVDGHLYDFDDRLHRVELHGNCPKEMFDRLLASFGWPETELTFELVREGITVGEAVFRERVQAE